MTRGGLRAALAALFLAAGTAVAAAADALPRTVLALYDGSQEDHLRLTRIHQMAEMPLNHLGLSVVYADIQDGLPDLESYPGLRGIVTWFVTDRLPDPEGYLDWLSSAIDRGLRVAVLGSIAAYSDPKGRRVPLERVNRVLARLGLRDEGEWTDLTYSERPTVKVSRYVEFDRALGPVLPAHGQFSKIDPSVESLLVLRDATTGTESHLIVTGGAGGFAAADYARFFDEHFQRRMWRIDPFEFFRRAFATDDLPKPDTTTLDGRRIYYSHIDGDGWLNVTTVPHPGERKILSSEIILERVIKTHPDLPITVGPIMAELEDKWVGTEEARDIARAAFALPWVEAASHTTSHPFRWRFYKDYTRAKEETFMRQAIAQEKRRGRHGLESLTEDQLAAAALNPFGFHLEIADQPRAYMKYPFDLDDEIAGSLAFVRTLVPPGKDVPLLQWPGDCQPFPAAIAATRKAGVLNLNGGDSRFDSAFPSYATVSPIGVLVGGQRQIYSSNSNENTYTDLWTDRYFAFRELRQTVQNTETPIRVKPFNIYYHMYSGEKTASLNAVLGNLEKARASDITPVTTSHFARIAEGFYTTRLIATGDRQWRVEDRGALQTLRFDRASLTAVDFARSEGVIGERHFQGSLYVALDPASPAPVVALTDYDRPDLPPPADVPYVVASRWPLENLRRSAEGLTVEASGFGAGRMTWRVPEAGRYAIEAVAADGAPAWRGEAEADEAGRLTFTVDADGIAPLTLTIRRLGPAAPA